MKQPTIIWADDDPEDRMMMREVLHSVGDHHEIVEVDNGRKLLDRLQCMRQPDQLPCLIVMDMNMPVLSGRDALVLIKNDPAFDGVPVVVFSASNSSLDRMFCKRYGAEMIMKPPNFASFQEIIKQLLGYCGNAAQERSNDARHRGSGEC